MIRPYTKFLILAPWLGPLMGLSAKWWLCAASLWYGGSDKLSLMGFLSYLLWGFFSSLFFYISFFRWGFFFRGCLLDGRVNWSGWSVDRAMGLLRLVEESLEFGDWLLLYSCVLTLFFLFFFFVKFLRCTIISSLHTLLCFVKLLELF